MPEQFIYKSTDRVIFPPGKQGQFFESAREKANITWADFARQLSINPRSLSYYRNENYSVSFDMIQKIMKISVISFLKNVEIKDQFWSKATAGKLGGEFIVKKYGKVGGDESYRNEQWKKWWETKGKKSQQPILTRQEVPKPKPSSNLAELFGILIGDGGLTKYQMTITLNGDTDKRYSIFVISLLKNLFEIDPKVYTVKNSKAINIVISRSNLVDFLVERGLKRGHKINQNVIIPDWILKSKDYKIPCLRGMVDTDGSVVHETHQIKGKEYVYPRLNFTSASPLLVQQTIKILIELGFHPKLRRGGRSVQLENLSEICQYFSIVGSSNPKHRDRISAWY